MIFSCKKQILLEAVQNVQRAVSNRSTLTMLEGIYLKTEEDGIFLCGYNLEIGITTKISAVVKNNGEIVLAAKIFADIIKAMPEEEILISCDEKYITTIKSGVSEFSIIGLSPEDYPELPAIESVFDAQISAETLKSMVRQTIFAVSDSGEKPINTGILFDIKDNRINLIAVDGYRLSKRTEEIKSESNKKFVVPGKTLGELLKLIGDTEEVVQISIGFKHVTFKFGSYCVISRLLEGEFLNYDAAIPKDGKTKVKIKTKHFIECIKRVSLVITDRLRSPVRCIFSNGMLKASCVTPVGRANDEISIDQSGEIVEIGFNKRYLLEALEHVEEDEVVLQMGGSLSPLKILPPQGEGFVFLVLPVRLKNSEE